VSAPAGSGPRRSPWIRIGRTIRAFFSLPGSRVFLAMLILFLVLLVVAVIVLDVSYALPGDPDGLDTLQAIYAVFGMLFFEHVFDLPHDRLSAVLFFLVPVVGILTLGQLFVRLGTTVLNREKWEMAKASTYSDHVIVCGLGRVGFRVCRWLLDLGEEVVVVDLDDEDSLYDQVRSWGVPIIVADARRPEILETAGLQAASAIVPVTGDDLVNLAIATAARGLRPDMRVVLRTFDDALAANLQTGFDIHRAYSTSALAAPAFAAAAVHAPVDYAFSYETESDGELSQALVTITKFTLVEGCKLAGYTVEQLENEFDVNVIAVRTKGFEVHPPADRVLNVGEGFVVSATPEGLDQLAKYVPPTREMRRYLQGRWPILT
jgi:voltage-gated potassium channel